jgi:hypothetical protein
MVNCGTGTGYVTLNLSMIERIDERFVYAGA